VEDEVLGKAQNIRSLLVFALDPLVQLHQLTIAVHYFVPNWPPILHLSCGRVGVVSDDCFAMEQVAHCEAIVLNGTGPNSARTTSKDLSHQTLLHHPSTDSHNHSNW
jgi:hypothetical protein